MKQPHSWIFWMLLLNSTLVLAQSLEKQFQAADAELNLVYKEIRSKLNENQKSELKKLQMEWLKEVYKIADQPRGTQQYLTASEQRNKFLADVTRIRVNFLKDLFQKITGISFLQHEFESAQKVFQKADDDLNITYQRLKSQIGNKDFEKLKAEQKKWLISFNKLQSIHEGDLFHKLRALEKRIQITQLRSAELKEKIFLNDSDSDKKWEELRRIEEEKFSKEFGLRPVYQSCPYDAENIVAEAENGKYRAISLSNSNRIYVFDNTSKLLMGECEVWGEFFEGVATTIQFADGGHYVYAEKGGFRGGDHCFFHVPSLSLAHCESADRRLVLAPLSAGRGYTGIASSRFEKEDLLKAIQEEKGFLFKDVFQLNFKSSRDFLQNFPIAASRIGKFELMQDYFFQENEILKTKFFSGVKEKWQGKCVSNNIEPSLHYSKRASRQIEDVSASGDDFVFLERNKNLFRNINLNLLHLKLSEGGEASSGMVLNPTTFGESLDLQYKKLEDKNISVKSDCFTCEIDQKRDSSIAEITLSKSKQKIMIPWHGQQLTTSEFFQMARYHDGLNPLLAAFSMRQEKAWNLYSFGLYNPNAKKWIYESGNNRSGRNFSEIRRYWYDSNCGDVWLSEPQPNEWVDDKLVSERGSLNLIDGSTGLVKKKLPCDQLFEVFAIGKNHLVGLPRMDEQRFQVWTMEPFSKLFDVYWDEDFSLSFVCTDAFYSTALKSIKKMAVRSYEHAYPFEQFDLRLNRPDIVLERLGAPDEAIAIAKRLREKRLKRMGVSEDMLQPDFHLPEIEMGGDLPSSTAEGELAIEIKAFDSKYPLDRLRLYVNNVPVNGKEGELLRDAKSRSLERTIPIKLAAGRNKIQVSVLNSAGAESLYANAEVTCTAQRPKPTLYAVAMGVSEYANPEWNLKYAAKDARDILERVKVRSGSSYGEIKELLLTDREATKENLGKIREFLSPATVDDTVLLFVAGHGLLDNKYNYYFGTSDSDFANPSEKGIAFEEFDDLLAELPCLRKSLLIDTCHAGEIDDDEKKMLANAQSDPSQVVAMIPAGARGMTIKPIEGARGKSEWHDRLQGLFVDLRRGSGSTILSSSAGVEYAIESSEQKNGLFTYAVLEALNRREGSDANRDGCITMSELAAYVKTRVADLSNNKQSPNVRRINLEGDFALSKE